MKQSIAALILVGLMVAVTGCAVFKALEHPNGHSSHGPAYGGHGNGYGYGGGHNH